LQRPAIDGSAKTTEVVMVAHALDLDLLPVQKEAFINIERKRADSEGRLVIVTHLAVTFDGCDSFVQPGILNDHNAGLLTVKFWMISQTESLGATLSNFTAVTFCRLCQRQLSST
jgi:hypothetical protein